jgi:zona occludens toxin (predicted ATPase)
VVNKRTSSIATEPSRESKRPSARRKVWSRRRTLSWGKGRNRRGVTAVETAIIILFLLTLIIGMMQFAWMFMVRHAMQHACRESARVYAVQGATAAQAADRANQLLQGFFGAGFAGEFSVTPGATGNDRTVTISIPTSSNLLTFGLPDLLTSLCAAQGGQFDRAQDIPTLNAGASFRDEASF